MLYSTFRYGPLVVTLEADTGRIASCRCLIEGVKPGDFRREYINAACSFARTAWESTIDR